MLNINEVFSAIQGEGSTAGMPAVFIRLSGCNLTCDWCDSKYTWHKDHLEGADRMTEQQLAMAIQFEQPEHNRIVWTGGEPVLQSESIYNYIQKYAKNIYNEIETNGTKSMSIDLAESLDVITVSPKLKNSKILEPRRYIPPILKNYAHHSYTGKTFWKFVIKEPADVVEIKVDFEIALGIQPKKIYLMPEGITSADQIKAMPEIFELCQKYLYNFSPRLQVLAYNDERKR